MKVYRSRDPLASAVRYARRCSDAVISRNGDLVVVTHLNGHKKAFCRPDEISVMNRLLSSLEITSWGARAIAECSCRYPNRCRRCAS